MEDKAQQSGGADGWDATQWHVVQKGETLSKIAAQSLYPQIFEANRDVLKDPNLIRVAHAVVHGVTFYSLEFMTANSPFLRRRRGQLVRAQ